MQPARPVLVLALLLTGCVEEQLVQVDVEKYKEQESKYITRLTNAFLQELAQTRNLLPMRRYFVSASGFSMQEYFRRKFGHAFGTIRLTSWNRDDFEMELLPALAVVNATVTTELLLKNNQKEERQVEFVWTRIRGRWYLMSK